MEIKRITLPPITAPGEVTTVYAFDGGAARSVALSSMAVLLASRHNATVPVLMIDWDTESPGLHQVFARDGGHADSSRPGLVEYFEACHEQLHSLRRSHGGLDDDALARLVLEAIDWEAYVERVDDSRPLYLMRAGRFDDSYGERAHRLDWDGMFAACPALFRAFAGHLARQFRHILVDCRSGRSAAVSVCTTLLPDKLVALFTPNQRSLDGMAGVARRAIDYRCTHEDEQRPLLVYPVPCVIDCSDGQRRMQWRRGDPGRGIPGYQAALEQLLRDCYGLSRLSLDSYLDEVQLQQSHAMSGAGHPGAAPERDADRYSLARTLESLLGWVADGRFPWQSRAEVELLRAIEDARRGSAEGRSLAAALPLAQQLLQLGQLYRQQGRPREAQESLEESLGLRRRVLGEEHPDTRAARAALGALLRETGRLPEARFLYQVLADDCARLAGPDHPETLAARSGLASTLAQLGEFERALALHDDITAACEARFGPSHMATLDSLAAQADTLGRQGEYTRARMVYERVLEGRQRLLGSEHEDTLRCMQRLAGVLCDMGDMHHARKLQESVVQARERHAGPDALATLQAREALAEIYAAQGDLDAVRGLQESLARTRERRYGAEHPDTLSIQLRLAGTLSQQGELEAARRLQQHVVTLQERIHGTDDFETLRSKKLLAATLSSQGNSRDARKLEESVQQVSSRLQHLRAMPAGPHEPLAALPAGRTEVEDRRAAAAGETLGDKLAQLQALIENRSPREARALADSLRQSVLRANVAQPLRQRGVEMIRRVYDQEGDTEALLGFLQDAVASLEGALYEASAGRPLALR